MASYVLLEQFQSLSRKMLNHAEHQQWDRLPELEQERQQVIQQFFKHETITVDDSPRVESIINDVLSINEALAKLAEKTKRSIAKNIQGMKQRQTVHSAYLENK
jgi:hypothetical protein